ncbi:hypothetical protein PIB30_057805 [Stylosanthes scabra]|uniref:Uncharacterized protein n=1 Tax=Stylosanthes scabra TaxID=79078 RepID=A0ABU6XHQ0_9FABA|nr:hypothetical protein [Stylosanthes scabra]
MALMMLESVTTRRRRGAALGLELDELATAFLQVLEDVVDSGLAIVIIRKRARASSEGSCWEWYRTCKEEILKRRWRRCLWCGDGDSGRSSCGEPSPSPSSDCDGISNVEQIDEKEEATWTNPHLKKTCHSAYVG